ncbi:DNA-binding transcription factor, zf-fungal binuclear cluster type Toe2 [Schizosaccharomyces pombe]|uniref:Uncharacterized transcriptional regulatory protein C139.03 n=1 Tax=Schizosaccharomyces pombe (strain 972 / ATCC 24843) TaxID=284812 RepID=YII3_SCHPO|nr:putative transcription factor [Schizosaccharomyces pombe]Q9UTN0.1 RecName: Full=Uncharacterized transcriptional regulatory protein C139.03 [Schizosaccharomyces pombe 972h-]CAB59617.1 transcription factor, zf-fungal binuclear cluster type (predicted) [Schizosaccharomyces pombe]|eukprot:NP_593170.1 putative transcription factor [Schizosaccharomyces pombe]
MSETTKSGSKKSGQTSRRAIHSCLACRRKKLKCDHGRPCSNCLKRSTIQSCIYIDPGKTNYDKRFERGSEADELIDQLLSRVSMLEKRLNEVGTKSQSDYENQQSHNLPSTPSADAETQRNIGSLSVLDDTKSQYANYSSSSHVLWHLRNYHYLNLDQDIQEENDSLISPFFFRISPNESAYDYLPPKKVSDILIEQFFFRCHMLINVLHRPTFYVRYNDFWEKPHLRKPAFTSLLYAIYASALLATPVEVQKTWALGEDERYLQVDYHQAFRYALASSNFLFEPDLNALQALVLCQVVFDSDRIRAPPSLVGLILHVALCMGLHRDGSLYGLNPVISEIRRRVWANIVLSDLRTSETIGYPPQIVEGNYDTRLPSALPDEIHNVDSSVIISEATFVNIITKVSRAYSKCLKVLLGIIAPNYTRLLELDRELSNFFKELIEVNIPTSNTMHERHIRLLVSYLSNRFPILLHFPFLLKKNSAQFAYSHSRALESATLALNQLYELGSNPEYSKYSWYLWRYPPFHPCIVLLLDLLNSQKIIYLDDERVVLLNKIFSLFPRSSGKEHYQKAWALLQTSRAKVWEKLGLSTVDVSTTDVRLTNFEFFDANNLDINWDDWDAIFQHCPF